LFLYHLMGEWTFEYILFTFFSHLQYQIELLFWIIEIWKQFKTRVGYPLLNKLGGIQGTQGKTFINEASISV
jgi:hypothetical protein